MLYALGFISVVVLLTAGACGWSRWVAVFNGPDGERYRRRAAHGPFAGQVDVHDGPGSRHPRANPRDEGR